MTTQIRFLGVAAYEIVTSKGQHILIDPFLDHNPGSPLKSHQLERVDVVLVTHGAYDHLGDAAAIAQRYGAPVICGGDVYAYLCASGIPAGQLRATTWGIVVAVAGLHIRPVECHHWSQLTMPDGTRQTGVPMGFIVYADPNVRFYHYGDTAIFSDLKLIGELYQPTIGALGITEPVELNVDEVAAGQLLTGEMDPREGALAAQWLGLKVALPCHYINPDCEDVRAFNRYLDAARVRGEAVPRSIVMKPGDVIALDEAGEVVA